MQDPLFQGGFFFSFLFFSSIEEERICNIVLLLGVEQPDSVIHMYLSILL